MPQVNEQPYLDVYPELNLLESPLILFVALAILANYIVVGLNIFLHATHLVGIEPPIQQLFLLKELLGFEYSNGNQLITIGIDICAIALLVAYMLVLNRISRMIIQSLKQTWERLQSLPVAPFTTSRLRRLIAHAFAGQFAWLFGFLTVYGLWMRFIYTPDSATTSTAILVGVGFVLMFVFVLFMHTQFGQKCVNKYFESIGGYEDGSIGRRLHINYRSLTDLLDEDEMTELLPNTRVKQRLKEVETEAEA